MRAGALAGEVCESAANEGSGGADTRNLERVNLVLEGWMEDLHHRMELQLSESYRRFVLEPKQQDRKQRLTLRTS